MPTARTTAPPSDVRDLLLAEATRQFAARGFDGASLQDIAEAVGIRKPSLVYHFPTKEALRQAVLEKLLDHWNDVLPRLLLAASGKERFAAVLRELVSFFVADPDRARLLVREVLDRPRELRQVMARHLPRWIEVVCDYIRQGQADGSVHPDLDPEAYVLHVIDLVVSAVAVQHCTGALLPSGAAASSKGAAAAKDRYLDELVRLARAALFIPHRPKR
jgi:AcrR family transcriptional regulator